MEFFGVSSEEKEEDDSSDKENEEDDSSDKVNEEDDSSDEESSTIDPPAPSHRRRISTPSQEKLKSVKRVLDMEKQRRRFSMVEGPGDVTPEVLSGIFDAMKREDVRKLKIRHRNSIPEQVIVSLVEDDPAFLDKLPVQKSNWSFEMKKRVAVEYYILLNPDREPEDVLRMVNALNDVDLDNVLQSMINA
jgi:cell envelope opacity-associated protein A